MVILSATDFFDGNKENTWPSFAEHFWTAIFSLFTLHIGSGPVPRSRLTIWYCTDKGPPWYIPRSKNSSLELVNVTFDDITVEPQTLSGTWPGTNDLLPAELGFSPDLVLRTKINSKDHFIIVENKVTSKACLQSNQVENYPRLSKWLLDHNIGFDFLLLQSVGCNNNLADQTRLFQKEPWAAHFGILLWEEVFREMKRTKFMISGLPIETWQTYSTAMDTECDSANQTL